MKNNKLNIFFVVVVIGVAFALIYNKYWNYTVTESGLKYKFIRGSALDSTLDDTHYCLINYVIIGPDGDTIQNSYTADTSVEVPYPAKPINELTEALMLASEGSKVEVVLSTDSLKQKNSADYRVKLLPNGEEAKIIFEVEKIYTLQEYFDFTQEKFKKRKEIEDAAIRKYCIEHKEKGVWYYYSYSGIYYRLIGENAPDILHDHYMNHPQIEEGKRVSFDIVINRLNGDLIVDSRLESRKYLAEYGGFINQIPAMNELPFFVPDSSEMECVIPSKFGWGAEGRIGVPSYSPLYVKLLNVKEIE